VQKLHAALALLPVDDRKAEYLREQLLQVKPSQFPVVRDALMPHQAAIVEPLWSAALAGEGDPRERFQAACALAAYAPADERWVRIGAQVAARLVTQETSEHVTWRKALQPAARQLVAPLGAIYRSSAEREQARTYAAETLAEYAADDTRALLELLGDAEQFQFPLIYSRLSDRREQFVALGRVELQKEPAAEASETERERFARRQANVAVALLKLGVAEPAWPLLRHSPDPRARSYLIHWLVPLGGDPQQLLRRFDEEPDVTIRRALLLALGEYSEAQLPQESREALIEKLLQLLENDPDAGLHGAAEWLLRRWEHTEQLNTVTQKFRTNEEQLRARPASDRRQWYINTQGQTFAILDAREFRMGSPEWDPERLPDEMPHQRRIGRTVAISAKEVTRNEYQRFLNDDENRDVARHDIDQYSRTDDSPQVSVSWYDAARYCNWLSKVEGIAEDQWCYEPNEQKKYEEGMRPAANFLERAGYRLATEAEWEFACRAGTSSSRYYGADPALLPRYAWALENSPGNHCRPTGRLKPNDFGLSDMLGNALEWCHDVYGSRYSIDGDGAANDVVAAPGVVKEIDSRVLRGGSHSLPASRVRSAYRLDIRPGALTNLVGFRLSRTYRWSGEAARRENIGSRE
jgi:formylglycine-generating enzyme required for sulfatase activity